MTKQEKTAQAIKEEVTSFAQEFQHINEEWASLSLDSERWCLKEILGHLIDSASNNHQRLVRFQIEESLQFPDYQFQPWLDAGQYKSMEYCVLLDLFKNLNLLIAHLIKSTPDEFLNRRWDVSWGDQSQILLGQLIPHYLEHLQFHLNQFRERFQEVKEYSQGRS